MDTQLNKSKELRASVRLVNDRLHFAGTVDGNEPISIDYIAPLGDNLGYTSLELLLLSLSSCLGSAVLTFLRKMNKTISNCEINAHGIRNDEHPTGFKQINIELKITSPNATEQDLVKVVQLLEDKYCPVLAMLKGNVEIEIISRLNNC